MQADVVVGVTDFIRAERHLVLWGELLPADRTLFSWNLFGPQNLTEGFRCFIFLRYFVPMFANSFADYIGEAGTE